MADGEHSENPADRRTAPRQPTILRGKVFPGAVDCVVADMSERGACVTFEDEPVDGERLMLVMWSTGLAFDGEVRWRRGRKVGLRFVSRVDFRSRTPAAFHEARALWRKSRPKVRKRYRSARSPMLGAPSA